MTAHPHRYDEAACAAIYRVIHERRDVRHFVSSTIGPEVLGRILGAARALAALLRFPPDARPIAVLCLGDVAAFDPSPRLELDQWRRMRPVSDLVYENHWPEGAA